ncbi:hypothetical protein Zmor_006408 [Zophobas morio]|uniref:Uncharacterized protein n=1 Tax=Zophobas morio TaxID=2755281 RepID=A0AA38IUW8_9CUCU|nr:hypothetical protein Zmor_006408 [Zophobas morio]
MYKITSWCNLMNSLTRWTGLLDSIIIVPEVGLYLKPYSPSRSFVIQVFLESIATSASRPFSSECRPLSSPYTLESSRRPIGVVPGRPVGLFRNNTKYTFHNYLKDDMVAS